MSAHTALGPTSFINAFIISCPYSLMKSVHYSFNIVIFHYTVLLICTSFCIVVGRASQMSITTFIMSAYNNDDIRFQFGRDYYVIMCKTVE